MSDPAPNRRWFQFSLRLLVLVVVALAGGLAAAAQAGAQPKAIDWSAREPEIPDTPPRDSDAPDPVLDRVIDVHYKNAKLSEVLQDLRKRTGLHGAYLWYVDAVTSITLDAAGITVRKLLSRIAKDERLDVQMEGGLAVFRLPVDRKVREKLRHTRISFEFIDQPFREAVAYIAAVAGIRIVLDPDVKVDGKSFDGNLPINLKIQDMSAENSLEWIWRLGEMDHIVIDDVLHLHARYGRVEEGEFAKAYLARIFEEGRPDKLWVDARLVRTQKPLLLLAAALKDSSLAKRRSAVYALATLRSTEASDLLREALKDSQPDIRAEAIFALAVADHAKAFELAKALVANDPALNVRVAALKAISRTGGESGHALIVRHVDDPTLAPHAIRLLGRPGDERHLDRLTKWLHNKRTSTSAMHALCMIGTDRARILLEQAALDPVPPLELKDIIGALGEMGDPKALSFLERLQTDPPVHAWADNGWFLYYASRAMIRIIGDDEEYLPFLERALYRTPGEGDRGYEMFSDGPRPRALNSPAGLRMLKRVLNREAGGALPPRPWRRNFVRRLHRPISVQFNELSLGHYVEEYLGRSVPISLGLTDEERKLAVTLYANRMPLHRALRQVLEQAGINFTIKRGEIVRTWPFPDVFPSNHKGMLEHYDGYDMVRVWAARELMRFHGSLPSQVIKEFTRVEPIGDVDQGLYSARNEFYPVPPSELEEAAHFNDPPPPPRPLPPELRFNEHEFEPWTQQGDMHVVPGWPFSAAEAERRQRSAADELGVPVKKTHSLKDGTTIEFVLIPAGSFVMGALYPPEPPAPPSGPHFGHVARMIGLATLAVLFVAVAGGAVRERRRPRFSLLWMLGIVAAAGVTIMGDARARQFDRQATAYRQALARRQREYEAFQQRENGGETPAHVVTITRPFYMSRTEITCAQWKALMGKAALNATKNLRLPAVSNRTDASRVMTALSHHTGQVCRLPTEAEWEYACRAGTNAPYSFGEAVRLAAHAWFEENSKKSLHSVGGKDPNRWGLHDMHGNAAEWCADFYGDYFPQAETDPRGPSLAEVVTPPKFVVRGGSVFNGKDALRSTSRDSESSIYTPRRTGFRIVMEVRP